MKATGKKKEVWMHQFVQFFGSEAWIPLSIGLITAHSRSNEEFNRNYEINDLLYERMSPQEIVAKYDDPYILAFSTYLWNINLSLEVARLAKESFPHVIIVFGGPSVPCDVGAADPFLRKHPFIDAVIGNEGESSFLEYSLALLNNTDLLTLAGLHRVVDNVYMPSPARQLTKNLDDLASPYLNGTFDGIMNRGIKFHAIWETNRGCPFQCGFCYWGNQSRALKARASAERIEQEMDWFVKNEINLLYIADSNFGWSDQDIVTAKGLVYCKRKYGFPNKVIVSWAKNATDKCFEVAKILNSASACYPITMSYQSLDKEALKNIKRSNIALDHSKELRQKYRAANLSTYTDLLIGIPGETSESFINGLENIISSGEHDQIQIYPIRILPNTDMAQPEYIKEHKVKTIWTPLQSKHGSLSNDDPVTETEEIIIATSTMPTPDWRMAMEITWFTQSFFCLKSAFFICLFLNLHLGQRIMDFAQFFLQKIRENKNNQFPLLHREMNRVENYLDNFLKGDPMVDTSDLDLLAVRWPIEEVSFIKLSLERKSFYKELQSIVDEFIALKKLECDPKLLNQIFQYQEARIVNLEGPGDTQLIFDYNIPQFFDAAMLLKPIMIKPQSVKIHIEENYHYNNLTEFTQYHVWYGRQGKAFYYKLSYD